MNISMFLKIIFGVLVLVGFYAYFIYQGGLSVKGPIITKQEKGPIITKKEGVTIPQKTEFGSQLPTGFLSTIPLEAKAALTQSYGLDYGAQKQLTAVFDSSKTVSQNYVLYAKFLTSNDWILQNTHQEQHISSLYGVKDTSDINITISDFYATSTVKSQVSISILNK